jgi:hypothetical protein
MFRDVLQIPRIPAKLISHLSVHQIHAYIQWRNA